MCLGLEFRANAELRKDRAFQFIHTFDALATLVGMIRTSNIGVAVDLFEMHVVGNGFEEARKVGDRIVSVILADAPADKPAASLQDTDRLLPGENGTIDVPAVLVALTELGYDGPITPSVSSANTKGMKRDQIVKTAGERLTQAWTAAGLSPTGKRAAAV